MRRDICIAYSDFFFLSMRKSQVQMRKSNTILRKMLLREPQLFKRKLTAK